MKKQILILAIFMVALIAGTSKSYGQYVNYVEGASAACTPAVSLTCASSADALHPLPGETYTYSVTTSPGTVQSIHWFVTDEANVITGNPTTAPVLQPNRDAGDGTGDYILAVGPTLQAGSANYNDNTNTTAQISISWKSFNSTTHQVLLVAYVTGASGCSDNIEVYRIEPTFGFTLDIAGLLDDGTLGSQECLSPVESATYDGTNLTMDYGENWIFFTVNAANFVNSWQPTFTTTYTGAGTVSAIEWAYPADALANTNWNAATVPVQAKDASGAVGTGGECIILRVQIDHGSDELPDPTAITFTMGVDGIMFDPAAAAGSKYANNDMRDLDEPAAAGACINDHTDEAIYTLTARPALTSTTVGVAPNPNPGPFEPKN